MSKLDESDTKVMKEMKTPMWRCAQSWGSYFQKVTSVDLVR
jgi:hypothetical protein